MDFTPDDDDGDDSGIPTDGGGADFADCMEFDANDEPEEEEVGLPGWGRSTVGWWMGIMRVLMQMMMVMVRRSPYPLPLPYKIRTTPG